MQADSASGERSLPMGVVHVCPRETQWNRLPMGKVMQFSSSCSRKGKQLIGFVVVFE